jgi:hypothetical protein
MVTKYSYMRGCMCLYVCTRVHVHAHTQILSTTHSHMRTKEGKAAAARLEILVWENYGARRLHRIQMMSNACIVSELIPITHEVTCTCVFVVLAQVHAYTNRIQRMGTQIDTWATHSRKTCPKGLQHSVNPRHLRRAGCVPSEAHQA